MANLKMKPEQMKPKTEQMTVVSIKDLVIDESIRLILDASERLKCTVYTRSKALLICHQFKRCIDEIKYDNALVAAASLSLSIKLYDEPVEFDALIHVFFSMVEGSVQCTKDKKLKVIRKSLTMMECLILRMLEFSLNHVLAHEFMAYFTFELQEVLTLVNVFDVFLDMSMRIVSDFYLSNKCLNYKPDHIAIAVIQAALYVLGIDVNSKDCQLKIWLEILSNTPDSIKWDIIEDIFKICGVGPIAEAQRVYRETHKLCQN